MRDVKKIVSLALALVMVLSMMVTASAAFADQDQINDKYAEAVEVMAELNILLGDGNCISVSADVVVVVYITKQL